MHSDLDLSAFGEAPLSLQTPPTCTPGSSFLQETGFGQNRGPLLFGPEKRIYSLCAKLQSEPLTPSLPAKPVGTLDLQRC